MSYVKYYMVLTTEYEFESYQEGKKTTYKLYLKLFIRKNKDILSKNIHKKLTKDAPMVTTCLLPPVFDIYTQKKNLIYADKRVMPTH